MVISPIIPAGAHRACRSRRLPPTSFFVGVVEGVALLMSKLGGERGAEKALRALM